MDLRQLRYFSAIVEHGTLSQAAQNLRIAASALSHHLNNLERELGTSLFQRKPRGMEPTAAGHRLNEHAKQILRAVEAAQSDIRESTGQIAGSVSVGMAYSAVKAIGVALAERVLIDFPQVELALTESLSGATLVNLMTSEVDLALVYNPPDDPALRSEPVLEERMVCVGRREIIGESDAPIHFDELLELPIILLRQGVSARAIMDDVSLLKKIEARARLQMNSVQAISGSLEAGLGCVIGTKLFMQDQLESGVLHHRPITEPELSRTLCICELSSRPPTFALEAIKELILRLIEDTIENEVWEANWLKNSIVRRQHPNPRQHP